MGEDTFDHLYYYNNKGLLSHMLSWVSLLQVKANRSIEENLQTIGFKIFQMDRLILSLDENQYEKVKNR